MPATARQRILPVRRDYNRWVANQTLEDYALRFTAKSARKWSTDRIAQTAIGAISFLALEAIGGAITLSYGTPNALAAIAVVCVIMLVTGWPIARYASRHGVDIDLLTRGAGFGYIGSTITSLVYASFTFILFAIEASIMSTALELALGIPLWLSYVVSTVVVIPLVTHGVTWISRFQLLTQPFWIVLNILPFVFIAFADWGTFESWFHFVGQEQFAASSPGDTGFNLLHFGAAAAVILALIPQIGEQVDFLRFLPERKASRRRSWLMAVFLAGPGWVVLGAPKMVAGSFLAVLALNAGVPHEHAAEPAQMYGIAFGYVLPTREMAYLLTAAFVVISQLKINVMNAYAGSLAWSNFFSRLTHSHPGRVVWLIFNVAIALLLMELGIYRALEQTLGVFAIVAVSWVATISADLLINKPLGFSPPGIEFKRAHLYDVNPVGVGAMAAASALGIIAHFGVIGAIPQAFAPFMALAAAFVFAPLIAWGTGGRYYLARKARASWRLKPSLTCSVCQHDFEPEDMSYCPAYAAPICSLCCSLDARCHDTCKPHARLDRQIGFAAEKLLPSRLLAVVTSRVGRYCLDLAFWSACVGLIMLFVYRQASVASGTDAVTLARVLAVLFFIFMVMIGIVVWFFTLARDSRRVAEEESARQTSLLLQEISAHRKTDAALQKAKEKAEAANLAKSRYVVGLSHELRTPLNAVLGYAQILERDQAIAPERQRSVQVIRRSAEHLSGLIDGLLDISKIEAGRLQVRMSAVRLHDFLDQIVGMFRLQAQAKGLDFHHTRSANLPQVVRTDEKRLRQILVNLLSNAIKFTGQGSVTLAVDYRSQVATFTVRDTGPGIAAEDHETIFQPFERGRQTQAVPGLGLGLTITRLLSETMGGELTMQSAPGAGSTFRVRLMLGAVEGASALAAERRIAGYRGARKTILVVDDNTDHRELMIELLRPLDFTVLTATDGADCLDRLDTATPDLFFVDISMPGMNGWELVSALRARGLTQPIIMLSANIGDGAMPSSDLGHDDLLAKPFAVVDLIDKIGSHLKIDFFDEDDSADDASASDGAAPVRSPGAAHVAELLSLGAIGHVRGIEAKLAALADDPDNQPLVDRLREHVRAFDFAGYAALLTEMSEP
ncbi:hybrid sensor histidine kinase/response regulator [Oryzibacter oryziterrae]|uniref:hybrid sensor histidine kinase/response regulator n=1 Tax=Oryzibacter oryziterrae TaxID=2766474 RepID=UPI001F408629|nr:ATP-binding protein [Oryzibacter oryziterrae]